MIAVWDIAFVYHCVLHKMDISVNLYHTMHEDDSFVTSEDISTSTVSRGKLHPKSWQLRQINSPYQQS